MKKYFYYIFIINIIITITSSCTLDNYDAPNATLCGSIIDIETNELVEQDIINGTKIVIIESGFEISQEQFLVIKNDGTYRNTMIFANTYTVQPKRGNFAEIDPQDVVIKGETKLDFMVLPYIRVKDVNIYKTGTKIKATFYLQQTGYDDIQKIGLYVDREQTVGEPKRILAKEMPIGAKVKPDQLFTLEIDLTNSPILKTGETYFFRVGALINVPEAKFNYAKAIKIQI